MAVSSQPLSTPATCPPARPSSHHGTVIGAGLGCWGFGSSSKTNSKPGRGWSYRIPQEVTGSGRLQQWGTWPSAGYLGKSFTCLPFIHQACPESLGLALQPPHLLSCLILSPVQSWEVGVIITTFLGEETEAQRKAVTCPKSHSWEVAEVGFPPHRLLPSSPGLRNTGEVESAGCSDCMCVSGLDLWSWLRRWDCQKWECLVGRPGTVRRGRFHRRAGRRQARPGTQSSQFPAPASPPQSAPGTGVLVSSPIHHLTPLWASLFPSEEPGQRPGGDRGRHSCFFKPLSEEGVAGCR